MAIALFAVILPSTAKAEQGSTGPLANGGVLRLHLGSSGTSPQDYFALQLPDGSGGYVSSFAKTQSVGNGQGCKIALGTVSGATDPLVSFTPAGGSNPNTGFVSDAIGVVSSGEGNGQPCGRLDSPPGQTLALDLGTGLTGKVIDYAEIDVELKFSATVTVKGYLNGVQVGGTAEYGSSGSDSGPDSADGDNYRIRFPKLLPGCGACTTTVNRLVFGIKTTGGVSLEGGADGTQSCDITDPFECGGGTSDFNYSLGQTLGTGDSLFHLVDADGILDCPSGPGTDQASEQNPGVVESTLYRQENVGGAACTPIPYNLESGEGAYANCDPGSPQCILLQKDLLGQNTQFIWKVTWNPESTDYPETATEFDFDLDGTFQALQPCLADTDGDHLPQLPPTLDPGDGGALDPWCIMDTFVDFNPDTGQNTVTEWYFGGGDPGGKR